MAERINGGLIIGGPCPVDVTIDVSSGPYESGFKFNTLPFGGMTIDAGNAIRVGSASEVKLVPAATHSVVIGTTGALPAASASLRGALFVVQGAGGVADTLQACLKSAANTYSWKVLATG